MYEKGDILGNGDLAIQTFHLLANNIAEGNEESEEEEEEDALDPVLADAVEFFEQYIWVPQSSGGQFELDEGRIVTAVSGAGVLGGFNPKLTNADWNHTVAYHRTSWNEQPGVAHPGRGGSTPYYDVGLSALQTIQAGAEIFVSYGENWEDDEEEEDVEKSSKITREDHGKIDETIQKMIDFFSKHNDELDEASKLDIYDFLIKDVMSAAAGNRKGAKIKEMLPSHPDDLPDVLKRGGSIALESPEAVRPLEWLNTHGRCMDNIRPGPSTIPNAGRGAFATRDIASGSLVVPIPLVQIADERIMDMYPVKMLLDEEDEEYWVRDMDDGEAEPTGSQLLLNYCFGHPESRLMFFPAGVSAGFINHSREPNAKLQWSDHPNHHQHWLQMEPASLIDEGQQHLGLLMEIVAIKDIKEGDEVFIDYGNEWSEAWDEHVANWEKEQKLGNIPSVWPIRSLDLNEEYKDKPFEIEASYPDNIKLMCFLMVKKPENEAPVNDAGEKVRVWTDGGAKPSIRGENLFECKLHERNESDGQWSYTIAWTNDKNKTTWVKNVPHEAIVFVDKAETSDQHFAHGFRHYIGIPDDAFPQGPWRNIGDEEEEEEE